jgi:hypothetical protein
MNLITFLHVNNKEEITKKRTSMYEGHLEILLDQWEKERHYSKYGSMTSYLQFLSDKSWCWKVLMPLLQRIAYRALETSHAEHPGSINYCELVGRVAVYLSRSVNDSEQYKPYFAALRFLEYMETCIGLLTRIQTEDEECHIIFTNETIQHYLAGREIVGQVSTERCIALIMEHRTKPHWQQAILLGIEYMIQFTQEIPYIVLCQLVQLPERSLDDLFLAAEILINLIECKAGKLESMQQQIIRELQDSRSHMSNEQIQRSENLQSKLRAGQA